MAWQPGVLFDAARVASDLNVNQGVVALFALVVSLVVRRVRDCNRRFERARAWSDAQGCATDRKELMMKWVTRERPKVDRIACPWLIKRFVDPEAEFLYVPADQVSAVAEREAATPCDVPGAELGHHGDECSFDAIVRRYGLADKDPALARLAMIVRGADANQPDLTPESRGLTAIANGFSATYDDDHEQLRAELPVYDAL
jgi:hypothetical protein